jgi:hypothetical protein
MPRQPSITREALTELIDSVTPSALKHIALCLTWNDLEVPEDAEDTLQRLVNAWDTLESVTLVTEHVHETLLLNECPHIKWTFKSVSDRDLAGEYYEYWCSRDYV